MMIRMFEYQYYDEYTFIDIKMKWKLGIQLPVLACKRMESSEQAKFNIQGSARDMEKETIRG